MAIPPFGYLRLEWISSVLLICTGILALISSILGFDMKLASALLGQPWPAWFYPDPGRAILITQAAVISLGAIGVLILGDSFTVVAISSITGAIFVTPVGLLTCVPALLVLVLAVRRRRLFWEFSPRWRGPGPPPPGQWK